MNYKSYMITCLVMAFIMALMPWMTGPYILDVAGTFLVTQVLYWLWMAVAALWVWLGLSELFSRLMKRKKQ